MFILGNFVHAFAIILDYLLTFLFWLIIIRALLSWVNPDPYNAIVRFIERVTEPVLEPFRRLIPSHKMGLDLSPMIAGLFIYFLKLFVVTSLLQIAVRLR
jgi:YggT family protein